MDKEKVIKGLETCIPMKYETNEEKECRHEQCPYGRENYKPMNGCFWDLMSDALALLKEQESLIHFLEHQREKGHWIFGETNGHGWMKCSQCCVSQDGQTSCYLFCPCCGADMTEGR